ncbi:protein SSX1-like [Bubalus bubalis]|uniref:protein SSX1-like n=1 Tax=Bubalus bubalis TaxID=89462 RepID=UPI000DBC8566|nr:protein SSX1-like [Bubalus bubalis]
MNRGSFWENPREDRKKLEKKSKAFKTISQYFSKKEWARLGYSEKITYVNMKRNYETMTRLGLKCTPPAFMCPKNGATKSKHCDSKTENPRKKDEPPQGTSNMQGRKPQKVTPKKPVKGKKRSKIVPGTSGPEQAQRQLGSRAKASISAQQSKKTSGSKRKKVWANRLRKRKPVAYEEISDFEEESNGNTVDVWANRLQEREPVAQEEISDREEESNGNTVNVWANRLRKRKPVAYEEIIDPEEEEDEDD